MSYSKGVEDGDEGVEVIRRSGRGSKPIEEFRIRVRVCLTHGSRYVNTVERFATAEEAYAHAATLEALLLSGRQS